MQNKQTGTHTTEWPAWSVGLSRVLRHLFKPRMRKKILKRMRTSVHRNFHVTAGNAVVGHTTEIKTAERGDVPFMSAPSRHTVSFIQDHSRHGKDKPWQPCRRRFHSALRTALTGPPCAGSPPCMQILPTCAHAHKTLRTHAHFVLLFAINFTPLPSVSRERNSFFQVFSIIVRVKINTVPVLFFAWIFQLFPVKPHCGMLQHKF